MIRFLFRITSCLAQPSSATAAFWSALAHTGLLAVGMLWTLPVSQRAEFSGRTRVVQVELTFEMSDLDDKAERQVFQVAPLELPGDEPTPTAASSPTTIRVARRPDAEPRDRPPRISAPSIYRVPTISVNPPEIAESPPGAEPEESETRPTRRSPRQMRVQTAATPPQTVGVDDDYSPPNFSVNRAPKYPREARDRRWQGEVQLRLHVTADGSIERVEIVESSGYRILDESARRAVSRWRGRPAMRRGKAVKTTEKLRIRFEL